MLNPTVKRGLMLDFISDEIICAVSLDNNRVFKLNDKKISRGNIVYVMSRELRFEDNWGLIFAQELAKKHNKKFKVVVLLDDNFISKHQWLILLEGLRFLRKTLEYNNIDYEVSDRLPQKAGAFVFDFNPINLFANLAAKLDCACFEVDSHNIVPARFVSDKQEYSAATLRRKIYANISVFLTEFPQKFKSKLDLLAQQHKLLDDFIKNKLASYAELKNDPNKNITSCLSPYLHFGFISAQRVALEVLKSNADRENKEAFFEELIVRKELADNFCLYAQSFNTLKSIPAWAQKSFDEHRLDIRTYVYSLNDFEYAKTHDKLWNKIQENLLEFGKIHGYLRMYWAKKILEWSRSPEDALKIAIYLNDKYALDGNDPNGYVGILWSVGGVHDRAFTNRLVTGKIRYMSLQGCKQKFNVNDFIKG